MSSLCSLISELVTRHLLHSTGKKQKRQEPHLPTEILATIINEVASDTEDNDRTLAALASCRLASYALCSLTTPLFFSSIQLTDSVPPLASRRKTLKASRLLSKRAQNLNDILSIDDIANSVKTLTLRGDTQNLASRPNVVLISKLLHCLPHIQMFALESLDTGWEGFLSFRHMPKHFVSAIQALCKSPKLTTLHVHNVNFFPITAIAACPNLQRLRLWHAEPDVNLFFFLVHSQPLTLHSSSTAQIQLTRHQGCSSSTWIHWRLIMLPYFIVSHTILDHWQIFFARGSRISRSSIYFTTMRSWIMDGMSSF